MMLFCQKFLLLPLKIKSKEKLAHMSLFNWFAPTGDSSDVIKEYLEKGAVVVDVRTPLEFNEGHVKDSINIPLNTIDTRSLELKNLNKPFIAVCRSGARSGNATIFLKRQGLDVINGGPWQNVAAVIK
jgi:phage shock protein E